MEGSGDRSGFALHWRHEVQHSERWFDHQQLDLLDTAHVHNSQQCLGCSHIDYNGGYDELGGSGGCLQDPCACDWWISCSGRWDVCDCEPSCQRVSYHVGLDCSLDTQQYIVFGTRCLCGLRDPGFQLDQPYPPGVDSCGRVCVCGSFACGWHQQCGHFGLGGSRWGCFRIFEYDCIFGYRVGSE